MSKLIDKIKRDEVVEGEVKLTTVQHLDDFAVDERDLLAYMYTSKDVGMRYFATLLNSALTQGRVVFIITKKLMHWLIKNDPNTKIKSMNTKAYQTLLNRILTCGYIARTREPTGKRAGLYEVVYPDMLVLFRKTIAEQYIAVQKENTYKWYDTSDFEDKVKVTIKDPITEAAKKRVYERKRKREQEQIQH